MSQWQPITVEKCHSGNLWDRKPEPWCHATAAEGSLRNKNTHQICCVKKLRMAQAQSFRAHIPGGFKLPGLQNSPTCFENSTMLLNDGAKQLQHEAFNTNEREGKNAWKSNILTGQKHGKQGKLWMCINCYLQNVIVKQGMIMKAMNTKSCMVCARGWPNRIKWSDIMLWSWRKTGIWAIACSCQRTLATLHPVTSDCRSSACGSHNGGDS